MVEPSRNSPAALAAMLRTVARVPRRRRMEHGDRRADRERHEDATAATAGEPAQLLGVDPELLARHRVKCRVLVAHEALGEGRCLDSRTACRRSVDAQVSTSPRWLRRRRAARSPVTVLQRQRGRLDEDRVVLCIGSLPFTPPRDGSPTLRCRGAPPSGRDRGTARRTTQGRGRARRDVPGEHHDAKARSLTAMAARRLRHAGRQAATV